MKYRSRAALIVGALLVTSGAAHAGGPLPDSREMLLPQACKGGTNQGGSCLADRLECPDSTCGVATLLCDGGPRQGFPCTPDQSECPGSKCDVNFLKGPGTSFTAKLTLMIDDNVSGFTPCTSACIDNVVAVTVLLEVQKNGPKLFTQTFQNLFFGATAFDVVQALQLGPFISDTFTEVTEPVLQANVQAENVLYNFLFQQGDSQLADGLRNLFGVVGRPVIVGAPTKIQQYTYSDQTSNQLGSALRMKVRIRFVPL